MRQSLEPGKPAEKPGGRAGAAAGARAGGLTMRVKVLLGVVGVLAIAVAASMLWPEAEEAPPPLEGETATEAAPTTPGALPHRTMEERLPEGSGATHRVGP